MAGQEVRPQQLSIAEIARLWSAETGDSAKDLERELAEWAYAASADGASLGLGAQEGDAAPARLKVEPDPQRHLCWRDLENFCREQDRLPPHFWPGAAEAALAPPLATDSKADTGPVDLPQSDMSRLVIRAMERMAPRPLVTTGARRSPGHSDLTGRAPATQADRAAAEPAEYGTPPAAGSAPARTTAENLSLVSNAGRDSTSGGAKATEQKPAMAAKSWAPGDAATEPARRPPAEQTAREALPDRRRGSTRRQTRSRLGKIGADAQDVTVQVMGPAPSVGAARGKPPAAFSLPGVAAGAICGALLAAAGGAAWLEFGGPGLTTVWQAQPSAPAPAAPPAGENSQALASQLEESRRQIADLRARVGEVGGIDQRLSDAEQANAALRDTVQQLNTALEAAGASTGSATAAAQAAAQAAATRLSEALTTAQGEIEAGELARRKLEQQSAAMTEDLAAARAEIENLTRAGASESAAVARLEKELAAATAQIQTRTAGRRELEAGLAAAKAEFATAGARLSEMAAAETAARDEIENLNQSGAAAQAVIQRLEKELSGAKQEIQTETAGREEIAGRLAATNAELVGARGELETLARAGAAARTDVRRLEQDLSTANQRIAAETAGREELEAKLATRTAELESTRARVVALSTVEAEAGRLAAALAKSERDGEGLKTAAARASQDIASLNTQLETARQENAQLQAANQTAQARGRALEQDLSLAAKANTELRAEADGLNTQAAALSALLATAREQSGLLTAARDTATAKADTLARDLTSAEKEITSLRASLEGTSGTSAQLASKLAAAERRTAALSEARQATLARADSLTGDLAQSQDQIEALRAATKAATAEAERLGKELAAARRGASEQEAQRATAQARVESLAGSLAAARGEIGTLKSKASQEGEKANRLSSELDNWKAKAQGLAASLALAENPAARGAAVALQPQATVSKDALIGVAPSTGAEIDKLGSSDFVPAAALAGAAAPEPSVTSVTSATKTPSEAPAKQQTASRTNPTQLMLRRGGEYLQRGDVASARLFYEQAAEMGDTTALTAVGHTYDPRVLSGLGVRGTLADPAMARDWYERAIAAGDDQAKRDLQALRTWLNP